MKTLAVFNGKGGVGKTSLVYHLAHMFTLRGKRVVAADFDPQANLTAMFLGSERIESLWSEGGATTIPAAIQPLIEGTGDIHPIRPQSVAGGFEGTLALLAGDFALSAFEDELSLQWQRCLNGEPRAFRITSAFGRLLNSAGSALSADIALIDTAPRFGGIDRNALIPADFVIIPIAADLLSIRSLEAVGSALKRWRRDWHSRLEKAPCTLDFTLPQGEMRPLGYVVTRSPLHMRRAAKDFQNWIEKAPEVYRESVLEEMPQEELQQLLPCTVKRLSFPYAHGAGG